jgi:hypothetical protein
MKQTTKRKKSLEKESLKIDKAKEGKPQKQKTNAAESEKEDPKSPKSKPVRVGTPTTDAWYYVW